jgi:CRISPR-associated exonuclease Cas4
MTYAEDDLLMLSGIQHIAFCERQWALIHIEKQWQENVATIEGAHLHEKADNPYLKEKRNDLIIARSVNIVSYELGLTGIADVIEFVRSEAPEDCIKIPKRSGFWKPKVVEYKRGKPKHIDCDKVQLCAQAMCLEEMHNIKIVDGALFYNQIKHRENVVFDNVLRNSVKTYSVRMHELYEAGITPKAVLNKSCKNCSLYELCIPELSKLNVEKYMRNAAE